MSESASPPTPYIYEVKPRTRCGTPGCKRKPGHGNLGIWCRACAANLARIRGDYLSERASRRITGGFGNVSKKRGRPICCVVGCDNVRVPPEPHCAGCAMEIEEAA